MSDDPFTDDAVAVGDEDAIRALLAEVCDATGMGFAAVARVTDKRWVACQVEDKIAFGLSAGSELEIKKTICDEVREGGEAIVFDNADDDLHWRNHPVPALYGIRSYCGFPIYLKDGSFYGTLCAVDPDPRAVSDEDMRGLLTDYAERARAIVERE